MRSVFLNLLFLGSAVCFAQSTETAPREIVELEVARKVMDVGTLDQHFRDTLHESIESPDPNLDSNRNRPKSSQVRAAGEAQIREILQRFGDEDKKE